MAWAKIANYTEEKIKWEKAEALHTPFFFNSEDIKILLAQKDATGVTVETAIINGNPFLVMIAVADKEQSGKSTKFNTDQKHIIAFSCRPLRDNQGNKEINLDDLVFKANSSV